MSLVTYEDVRPWARAMKTRTGSAARRRDAAVVRREEHRHPEVQARSVAERRGDREDREVGRQRRAARQPGRHAEAAATSTTTDKWTIGEPDLILKSKDVHVPAVGPDWWGDFGLVPTGLTEDRYVSASKCARSTTSRAAAAPRPSAAATSSTT